MKIEIKYGVISGGSVCAWVLAEYFLGFHNQQLALGKISGYLATAIPVVVLYRALKEKHDQQADGEFETLAGVRSGLAISAVAAMITTPFLYAYKHFIHPGWMENALEFERAQLVKAGASPELIERKVAAFNVLNSDGIQLVTGLLGTLVMGLAISLIITSFLNRKTPTAG